MGPWIRLKLAWYRRRVAKIVWLMRYIDRMASLSGMTRHQIRQMWNDIINHPAVRARALDQIAVLNKIKIVRYERARYKIALAASERRRAMAEIALAELKAKPAEIPIDFLEAFLLNEGGHMNTILEDYGIQIYNTEDEHEVPAVQP